MNQIKIIESGGPYSAFPLRQPEYFYIIPTGSMWGDKASVNYPTREQALEAAQKALK